MLNLDSRVGFLRQPNFINNELDLNSFYRRLNSCLGNMDQVPLLPNNNNVYLANILGCIKNEQFNNLFVPTFQKEPEMLPLNLPPRLPFIPFKNATKPENPYLLEDLTTTQSMTPKLEEIENESFQYNMLNYNQQQYLQKLEFGDHLKTSNQTRRKFWLPSEDAQLIELVNIYGEKWSKIASVMQGRTGKQIRDRYINSLKPGIRQDAWTPAEDEMLIKLYRKIGNKWSKIAHCLKGRTENQVKNRFRTYLKRKIRKSIFDSLESEVISDSVNYKGEKFEDELESDSMNLKHSQEIHSLESELAGPRKKIHKEECHCQKQKLLNSTLSFSSQNMINPDGNYYGHKKSFKGKTINMEEIRRELTRKQYCEWEKCLSGTQENEELSPDCIKEEFSSTDNEGSDIKEEMTVKKEHI